MVVDGIPIRNQNDSGTTTPECCVSKGGYGILEVRDMLYPWNHGWDTCVGREEMFVGSEAAAIGNDCWTGEPEAREAAGCVLDCQKTATSCR